MLSLEVGGIRERTAEAHLELEIFCSVQKNLKCAVVVLFVRMCHQMLIMKM